VSGRAEARERWSKEAEAAATEAARALAERQQQLSDALKV
jgi:hypothetical protein